VPRIVQIGAGILKIWAFKCSGLACFASEHSGDYILLLDGATSVVTLFSPLGKLAGRAIYFSIYLTDVLRTIPYVELY